jgi:hypothetical protein
MRQQAHAFVIRKSMDESPEGLRLAWQTFAPCRMTLGGSLLGNAFALVVDDADLAINQKSSDNNEVRPRFSGRDNGVASSRSGRTYR